MSDADEKAGREPDRVLDVTGLSCPLPVLRAKMTLTRMAPGERLRVLATDPYSVMDFKAFCEKTGHVLVGHSERDGTFVFELERRGDEP